MSSLLTVVDPLEKQPTQNSTWTSCWERGKVSKPRSRFGHIILHLRLTHVHWLPGCQNPRATQEAIHTNMTFLGEFAWGYKDFSASSHDVNLELEGPTNEPMLHAKVDDGVGHLRESEVNLAGCIKNIDGNLRFMDCF